MGAEAALPSSTTIFYGDRPEQFGVLSVPPGDGPHPVCVFIHGGFWRNRHGLELAEPQVGDVALEGYATWNLEYRRVGDDGGGYPGTLSDVAAGVDQLASLADEHRLDLARVAVIGHSAGGHLALWTGQRGRLPPDAAGAGPLVAPALVVGQAPVTDLVDAFDLGAGAVVGFMGGPVEEIPMAYAHADPAQLLPVAVPQLIVHGTDDTSVPARHSAAYEVLVDDAAMLEVLWFDHADHFDMIDPAHVSWLAVRARLP